MSVGEAEGVAVMVVDEVVEPVALPVRVCVLEGVAVIEGVSDAVAVTDAAHPPIWRTALLNVSMT